MNESKLSLHLIWILIAPLFSGPVYGQNATCQEYIEYSTFFGGSTKKSKGVLTLKVSEKLIGKLKFSNSNLPYTIQISLEFRDTKGYSVDAGEILTTNFSDGSHFEIISSSRKLGSNSVQFVLIQAGRKQKKPMYYEDKIFFEKLRDTRISSFEILVDNAVRVIHFPESKSDTIRNIVSCLVEGIVAHSIEKVKSPN